MRRCETLVVSSPGRTATSQFWQYDFFCVKMLKYSCAPLGEPGGALWECSAAILVGESMALPSCFLVSLSSFSLHFFRFFTSVSTFFESFSIKNLLFLLYNKKYINFASNLDGVVKRFVDKIFFMAISKLGSRYGLFCGGMLRLL